MKIKLKYTRVFGFVVLIILFGRVNSQSQETTAILDIESTTQGVLFPRMTSEQRMAIQNSADALIVYDLNTASYWYFQEDSWVEVESRMQNITDKIRTGSIHGIAHMNAGLFVDGKAGFNDAVRLGSWNAGYPGDNIQFWLSGLHNFGANIGSPSTTYKLRIESYNNDGPTVYPIYVRDEDGLVDFFLKNRSGSSNRPTAYFAGHVGIQEDIQYQALTVRGASPFGLISVGPETVGDRLYFGSIESSGKVVIAGYDTGFAKVDVYLNYGGRIGIGTNAIANTGDVKLHVAGGNMQVVKQSAPQSSVILTSPDGNCFKLTVANDGTLSSVPETCP